MLKLETLKEKIEDYIVDLILKSDPESDWDNNFHKDDIVISCEKTIFNIRFRDHNWTNYQFYISPFKNDISILFNKEKRKENKELRIKQKQIRYFIENKTEIRKLKKIVDDFPIRIQRKEKLQKLNSQS